VIEEIDKLNQCIKKYEKDGVKEAIEKVFANRDNLALPMPMIIMFIHCFILRL